MGTRIVLEDQPITCDDLAILLGLPVVSITRNAPNEETGQFENIVQVNATTDQITADHQATIIDAVGGAVVVVEAVG